MSLIPDGLLSPSVDELVYLESGVVRLLVHVTPLKMNDMFNDLAIEFMRIRESTHRYCSTN